MAEENDIIFEEGTGDSLLEIIDYQVGLIMNLHELQLPDLDIEKANILSNAAKIILKAQKKILKDL